VVLPGCGRLSASRAARQKQRWFRRGQGWRAGIEARLSTLKHCFSMQRALYKGEIGFERYIGWCIIAQNLVAMSRAGLKSGALVVGEAMPTTKNQASSARVRLLRQIRQLAQGAIYGSLSETYRRCGNPDCRCHRGGPKHGPHLYISYRGTTGKTTGYYVPKALEAQIRQGVDAWSQLQDCLRELAALNKERQIPAKAKK
jgi:hypothetical protein